MTQLLTKTRTNHNDLYLLLALVAMFATFYFILPFTPIPEALEQIFLRDRDLVAEQAFAYDTTDGYIYFEKDADTVVPLASLTKVMTAVVVAEVIPVDELIPISERAIAEEVDNGLVANTVWTRDELLSLLLVESSNDAAVAFAEEYEKRGLDLLASMNAKATELELTTLHFTTVNGLDKNGVAGGVGSAREIAQLFDYAWTNHADIFSATTQKGVALAPVHESAVFAENTNKAILSLPGRVLSKTGMTRMAGGNLGVVVEKGPLHPIVVVVLGSTEYGRFDDVETIVEKVFER